MNQVLWRAIGQIGDDLISAADEKPIINRVQKTVRNRWRKYAGAAACFVLVFCAIAAIPWIAGRPAKQTGGGNAPQGYEQEGVAPYDAQLEIVCTNGKLLFLRIATTPRVRAELPCDGNETEKEVKEFDDRHEIITALFRAMDGKEALEPEDLFSPCCQILLSGQHEDEPWHYLFEISADGTVRLSNNGTLLCFLRISGEEFRSIMQTMND